MASVMKCDRCGEIGEPSEFMRIKAHELLTTETYRSKAKKHMDVCKNVIRKFLKKVRINNESKGH